MSELFLLVALRMACVLFLITVLLTAAKRAVPGAPAYAVSKAAVDSLTQNAALELAPRVCIMSQINCRAFLSACCMLWYESISLLPNMPPDPQDWDPLSYYHAGSAFWY